MYEKYEFQNINNFGEISNSWPSDLFGTNARKLFKSFDKYCSEYYDGLMLLQ